jgi:hypothetical protein
VGYEYMGVSGPGGGGKKPVNPYNIQRKDYDAIMSSSRIQRTWAGPKSTLLTMDMAMN